MPALSPFKLERYFGRHEFSARYLLSASDCESLSQAELLALADPDSLALWNRLTLGYTESPGHPALRAEIAGMYAELSAEDVLVLAPEEGIFIAMHALLEPGDHVVALAPAYQSLHEVARSIGCQVTPWTLSPQAGGWAMDLDRLAASLTPQTRLLVLNFPHNPTGFLPDRADWEAVLDLARERGLWVFSDEMYRLLEYDPEQRLPALCDVYEDSLSLSGLSKSLAAPGLRIGWLASRRADWLEQCLVLKDYTTICSSAPSEILALIALRARDAIVARNLAIVRANLARAQDFFGQYETLFRWLPPQAGSIAFPQWVGRRTPEAFCDALLGAEGVMIVPGSYFDFPGHLRIGLGRRNFPEALDRVRHFLETGYDETFAHGL